MRPTGAAALWQLATAGGGRRTGARHGHSRAVLLAAVRYVPPVGMANSPPAQRRFGRSRHLHPPQALRDPAFTRVLDTQTTSPAPFLDVIRNHPKQILLGMGCRYIEGVAFNLTSVGSLSSPTL